VVIIIYTIRRGVILAIKYPPIGIAKHYNQTSILCCAWAMERTRSLSFLSLLLLHIEGGPRQHTLQLYHNGSYVNGESPGTVATVARRIVAISEGGGHPFCQSGHVTAAFPCRYIIVHYILQYTFMLPLEVVDPGSSLSMLLLPPLNGETPVGEGILAGGRGDGSRQL
jgi:hypothetical protein